MAQKKLARLVETAKGSDRSIREYALAAEVNASTISRIINGTYTPGIKVLQKLTSQKASPRGGVTFQDLISATVPSAIQAMSNTVETVARIWFPPLLLKDLVELTPDGRGESVSTKKHQKKSKDEKPIDIYFKYLPQFSATAIGILYNQMAQNRIMFRPGNVDEADFDVRPFMIDAITHIEESSIAIWLFTCIPFLPEYPIMNSIVEKSATGMLQSLVLNVPDMHRKYSIIVNDDKLFNYLLNFREKNSYRGNLSVIQVDTKKVRVVREEYIAHYNLDNKNELLLI